MRVDRGEKNVTGHKVLAPALLLGFLGFSVGILELSRLFSWLLQIVWLVSYSYETADLIQYHPESTVAPQMRRKKPIMEGSWIIITRATAEAGEKLPKNTDFDVLRSRVVNWGT